MKRGFTTGVFMALWLAVSVPTHAEKHVGNLPAPRGVQVNSIQQLPLLETDRAHAAKVCGIEPDGRHILLTDPTNKGLYRYTVRTHRAKALSQDAGAGYGVRMDKRGLKRTYRHEYQVPDMPKPFGEQEGYLWTSVSPNGERCLFYVSGYGAFVCKMDGSELQRIGELHAARWLSDNQVVAMQDEDDGIAVTQSTIVVYDLRDGRLQHLTDAALRLMYPYADAKGQKIACSADDGAIYLINLQAR